MPNAFCNYKYDISIPKQHESRSVEDSSLYNFSLSKVF